MRVNSHARFFLGGGGDWGGGPKGLVFNRRSRLKQKKNTPSNLYLMKLICLLNSKGVQASLRIDSYYVLCVVEGIGNLQTLLSLFCFYIFNIKKKLFSLRRAPTIKKLEPHHELFFWKTHQLKMAQQFLKLISLDSRNLLPVKYLLIKTISPPSPLIYDGGVAVGGGGSFLQ